MLGDTVACDSSTGKRPSEMSLEGGLWAAPLAMFLRDELRFLQNLSSELARCPKDCQKANTATSGCVKTAVLQILMPMTEEDSNKNQGTAES